MNIKITVYSDSYLTHPIKEVTGFSNAEAAAHYRDNSDLRNLYTKLEPDDPMYDRDNIPSDAMSAMSVDYSHAADNGYTLTDEGWLYVGGGSC